MAKRSSRRKVMFGGELLFPSRYVSAEDLKGKDVIVTIKAIRKKTLPSNDGGEELVRLIEFRESSKQWILNVTNQNTIGDLYGDKAEDWLGKRITLFPTTCQCYGATVSCVRVRSEKPKTGDTGPKLPEPDKEDMPQEAGAA